MNRATDWFWTSPFTHGLVGSNTGVVRQHFNCAHFSDAGDLQLTTVLVRYWNFRIPRNHQDADCDTELYLEYSLLYSYFSTVTMTM
jgi:hypothetical protein